MTGARLPLLAATAMALPFPAQANSVHLPLCGGGTVELPLGPARQSPGACHAMFCDGQRLPRPRRSTTR